MASMQREPVNPYAAPASSTGTEGPPVTHGGKVLASRWRRLGARLIDGLIAAVALGPFRSAMGLGGFRAPRTLPEGFRELIKMSLGVFKTSASYAHTIAWAAFGFALSLAIHGYFIANGSQTIGKRVLGIQIIDARSGAPASFFKIVVLRALPLNAVVLIHRVGGLASLVDALCIFRRDHRCVHDHIAGTAVIMKPAT
jgi:uncharacterized RDD family membrane protein YckC